MSPLTNTSRRILQYSNPNTFASLITLNRKWRSVSQQAYLYAQHLARCPSYSAAHHSKPIPDDEGDLPLLRRLFAREIKRNLFEAYLRPRETIINLVSTSISSSSAPGGEAFHFNLSAKGHYILAYSSSRIHILDVTGSEVEIKRELKILRRPASTTITDDGSLLAVLSTDMQIDLYDLTGEHPKHTRVISLDHTPRTITLSPTGSVLAAAYDAGVEVSSLHPDSVNAERRAVKCYAVDSLSFSSDGTQLLGTTIQSRNPSTVVLTAPYYDPGGNLPEKSVSALWTTSILFPNGSRDCSHAVLLPNPSDDESTWTFTYDRVFETFRAVRIDDLRNGTTYFTGPIADTLDKLLPSTLPAASKEGDLVSAGFQGAIWLYGIPEDLEAVPTVHHGTSSSNAESEASTPSIQLGRRNSAPSLRSLNRPRESIARIPQWQLLVDKFRNTFVEGRKIASLDRVSALTWVNDYSKTFHSERLIAVAPGVGAFAPESEDDSMNPTDGGRISILDFDYAINNGRRRIITVEVGNAEPEVLEEEHRDLDTEVALVRRRTVAQRRGNRNAVSRSATTIARPPLHSIPSIIPSLSDLSHSFTPPSTAPRVPAQPLASSDRSETASIDDDQEAFDAPYSHTSPRSGTTLRRAATAAATNRRLHPRVVAQEHIEYRRADGREEHPHESDADNWVPPPPPYSKDPLPPLPEHIQRSILTEAANATLQRSRTQRAPSVDFPGLDGNTLQRSRTLASTSSISPTESRRDRYPFPRTFSDTTTRTVGSSPSVEEEPQSRRGVSPVSPAFDDLYDVSPPGSPQLRPRTNSEPARVVTLGGSDATLSPQLTPEITPPASENVVARKQIARKPVAATAPTAAAVAIPALVVRAPIQETVASITTPQPMGDGMGQRLRDWEHPTETSGTSTSQSASLPSSGSHIVAGGIGRDNLQQPTGQLLPQSNTPNVQQHQAAINSQPMTSPRRSETAPTAPSHTQSSSPIQPQRRAETLPVPSRSTNPQNPNPSAYAMTKAAMDATKHNIAPITNPSADQLARLNSRTRSPPAARRASALYPGHAQSPTTPPSRRAASSGDTSWATHLQQNQTPHAQPPRAALGAFGSSASPARSNTGLRHSGSPRSNSISPSPQSRSSPSSMAPARRLSLSNTNPIPSTTTNSSPVPKPSSNPSPRTTSSNVNLRPPMARLETINSVTSTGDPSPYFPPATKASSGNGALARNPSRAERSAAKNVRDARKRGWRGGKDKKDKKKGWEGSSAGWTDVSEVGVGGDGGGARGEKGRKTGKCVVM